MAKNQTPEDTINALMSDMCAEYLKSACNVFGFTEENATLAYMSVLNITIDFSHDKNNEHENWQAKMVLEMFRDSYSKFLTRMKEEFGTAK